MRRRCYSFWAQHECKEENFVSIGEAAKQAGVPYQYIYGIVDRSFEGKRPRVSALAVPKLDWSGQPVRDSDTGEIKEKRTVCPACVKDKYGTAQDEDNRVLVAKPVIGYRTWNIGQADLTLRSWHDHGFTWAPEGSTATCKKSHEPPGRRCQCGLYALNVPEKYSTHADVLGQVELWGKVIDGDRGWKAQHGKPTALLCDNWEKADLVHAVASKYKIPVTHSPKLLVSTNWGDVAEMMRGLELQEQSWQGKVGDESGYRRGTDGDSGSASFDASGARRNPGRASCRDAIAGASPELVALLKHLASEGLISPSNLEELIVFE